MPDVSNLDHHGRRLSQRDEDGLAFEHLLFETAADAAAFLAQAGGEAAKVVPGAPRKLPLSTGHSKVYFVEVGSAAPIEYSPADQVLCASAGAGLKEINAILAGNGQWLPVDANTENATIGDVINSGVSGCFEHGYGGMRDLTLGLEVALSSGEVIRLGGRVVKNVTGYDLQKLFIGGRGTLGLVCSAYLRLFAAPESELSLAWKFADAAAAFQAFQSIALSGVSTSALEIASLSWDEKIDRALSSSLPSSQRACALIARLSGRQEVVSQSSVAIKELVGAPAPALIKDEPERLLWRALCEDLLPADVEVQVVAPPAYLKHWLATPRADFDVRWKCRPSKGRLWLRFDDKAERDQVITFFKNSGANLVLAHATDMLEYVVSYLPGVDQRLSALRASLTKRFDPQGLMNPFVSLYGQ